MGRGLLRSSLRRCRMPGRRRRSRGRSRRKARLSFRHKPSRGAMRSSRARKSPQPIRFLQVGIFSRDQFPSSSGDLVGLRHGCCTAPPARRPEFSIYSSFAGSLAVEPRGFEPTPSAVQRRQDTLSEISGACKFPANDNFLLRMLCSIFQEVNSGCCTRSEGCHTILCARRISRKGGLSLSPCCVWP